MVDISGVLLPDAIREVPEYQGTFSLAFSLWPWTDGWGRLQPKKLNAVWRGLSPNEMAQCKGKLNPGGSLKLRADMRELVAGFYQADVKAVLGAAEDVTLADASERIKKARAVDDPFFGRLEMSRALGGYSGGRGDYQVTVPVAGDPPAVSPVAIEAVKWFEAERPALFERWEKLTDDFNRYWRDEQQHEWTQADVLGAQALHLVVEEEGDMKVWLNSDLFGGHSILIRVAADHQVDPPVMVG